MDNNSKMFDFRRFGLDGERKPFDLQQYWHILKRRKWFVILPVIITSLIGLYTALSIVKLYTSSSTVLLSGGKLLTRSVRSVVPGVTTDDELSDIQRYILSTQSIAQLINTLRLKIEPEFQQKAIQLNAQFPDLTVSEVEKMLFVQHIKSHITVEKIGTDFIRITAKHKDPHIAYQLAKTLTQVFIDEFNKREVGGIRGVRDFSEEQVEIYENKLQESEKELSRFEQKLLKSQIEESNIDMTTLARLRSDLGAMEVSIRDKEKRLRVIAPVLPSDDIDMTQIYKPAMASFKSDLYSHVDDLVEMLSKFDWKDPQIISLNNAINQSRELIQQEVEKVVDRLSGNHDLEAQRLLVEQNMIHVDLAILRYEKQALSNLINTLEGVMTKSPTQALKLAQLKQEVELNRQLYLNFLKQSAGTQIEEQVQRKDAEFKFEIIEAARKPLYPEGISRKLILLMSGAIGLCIGGALIYLLEYADQTIKDVDQVQQTLRLPVWGVIPNLTDYKLGVWRREGWLIIIAALAAIITGALIYILKRGVMFQG